MENTTFKRIVKSYRLNAEINDKFIAKIEEEKRTTKKYKSLSDFIEKKIREYVGE